MWSRFLPLRPISDSVFPSSPKVKNRKIVFGFFKNTTDQFLLGKVWWPWLEAEVVDSSALRLMINPGAGQPY